MTNEELVLKFNPATAASLTEADLAVMRGLSIEQIGVLAKAYPNQGHQRPYLLFHDAAVADNKQLYPLGTWQNLYNLRKYHGKQNFTAHTFKVLFQKPAKIPSLRTAGVPAKGKVIDLSSNEAAKLLREEFGPAPAVTEPPAPPEAPVASTKKGTTKPAASKGPAKGKTVDVGNKPKVTKEPVKAPETMAGDDEELQDFSETE